MYRLLGDFLEEWGGETATTARLLDALTDEALAREAAPGHRTTGELAWHLVTAYGSILWQTGLAFAGPDRSLPAPGEAATIASAYRHVVHEAAAAIRRSWTDEALAATRMLYGEVWPNGRTLSVLLRHEIHHRGQLSVLMRQAGLAIPELYGPTKETAAARKRQKPAEKGEPG